MIAPSLTSAARLPRRSSLSRSPTLWSAPDATTIRYDRLPRLTSTIIWIFLAIRPGRVSRRPTRLPGFQGSEIGVVVAHAREDVNLVALDLHAAAAPVAALAARLVLVAVALGQRQARRDAVDDRHEDLTVGVAR